MLFPSVRFLTLLLPVLCLVMFTPVVFANLPADAILVEAESSDQMDAGVTVVDIDGASGGQAIDNAKNARAVYEVDLPEAGKWYVWIRVLFPDGSKDSYWIGMDDATPNPHDSAGGDGAVKIYSEEGDSVNTADQPFGIWYWDAAVGGEARFFEVSAPGKHNLWAKGREPGSILDQILLTMDASFNAEVASQGDVITAVEPAGKAAVTWGRIKAR